MDLDRLLRRLQRGHLHNVRFHDVRAILEAVGFELVRVRGSHHIFRHTMVGEVLSLQNVAGNAKPYQIRQVLRTMERHDLKLRDSP